MTRASLAPALILCGALGGCATTEYRPLVDDGIAHGNYADDLADCQRLAEQRPASTSAANGAAIGGIFAALLGAAVGLRGNDIARVAAYGAANGGVQGAALGAAAQREIVARCMAARGYKVIAP